MKDLNALNNELDKDLEISLRDLRENKQDGSHVLYNLDKFLIEKGYTEDDDIYFAFNHLLDNYYTDDVCGMIDNLEASAYPQLDELGKAKVAMVNKLVRQSETLEKNYSSAQLGEYPYLHINLIDLRVEYASTMRVYLFLQDFKKAILKLEREKY